MSNFMEYKGYYSNPRYSAEDNVFWGKLDGISDSISFEGTTVNELKAAFAEAVEDYIDACKRNNMTPKTPKRQLGALKNKGTVIFEPGFKMTGEELFEPDWN